MVISVIQSADFSTGFLGERSRELLKGNLTVALTIAVGAVHISDQHVDLFVRDTRGQDRSEVFLPA